MELAKGEKNLSTLVRENGSIEYFDTYMLMESELSKFEVKTRANIAHLITCAVLTCYKDDNFKGSSVAYEINEQLGWNYNVDSYTGTGFNDRISSFRLYSMYKEVEVPAGTFIREGLCSARVIFYTDIEYKGATCVFNVSYLTQQHHDVRLKQIFFPTGQSWNDIISSFKLMRG